MNFWLLSYLFAFFGSVSFGYLLMRFGLPDTRMLPKQIKLGLAGIAGVIMFIFSALVSYFFFSPEYLYVIMPAITGLALFLIQVKEIIASPKTMKVAIPVARVSQATKHEKKTDLKSQEKERPKVSTSVVGAPLEAQEKPEIKEPLEQPESTFTGKFDSEREERLRKYRSRIDAPVEKPKIFEKPLYEKKPEEKQAKEAPESKETKPLEKPKAKQPGKAEGGLFGFLKPRTPHKSSETRTVSEQVHASKSHYSRRERYERRRGDMVEQVKTDMKSKQLPEAKQMPVAPLPIIDEESVSLDLGEGLDLSDLESIGDLGELSSEEGLVGLESADVSLGDLAGLSEIEEVPKEKGLACPHCGSKNSTIVYCPYCGKGLCSNCADSVKAEGNLVFYGCPTCKKEVIVKKES